MYKPVSVERGPSVGCWKELVSKLQIPAFTDKAPSSQEEDLMPGDGRHANQEQKGLEDNREHGKEESLPKSSHLNDTHSCGVLTLAFPISDHA